MTPTRRPVTVVIPVYGGLATTMDCVDAVLATVDLRHDRLLIVNDVGPEADLLEADLVDRIAGVDGARYVRNPRNLGFVGTCNRAAHELSDPMTDLLLLNSDTVPTPGWLDALAAAAASDAAVGLVCARSDAATIATIPFRRRRPERPLTRERTAAVHAALRDELPTLTIAPVAMGFCLLVRREVIERVGLFDEAFAPGYGEENDLCLRAAAQGFSSAIAHRALVFHAGGESFGARRVALRARHELLLQRRHPGYAAAVREYVTRGADPIDVHADALVPEDRSPLLVVDADRALSSDEVAAIRTVSAAATVTVRARTRTAFTSARDAGLPVLDADPGPRLWDGAVTLGSAPHDQLLAPRVARADGSELHSALTQLIEACGRPVDLDALRRRACDAGWSPPAPDLRATRRRLQLDARAPWLRRTLAGLRRRIRGVRRPAQSE